MRNIISCIVVISSLTPALAGPLRAGAVAVDVTPEKFPVLVNCYFNERIANSAQDKLHARCLVLDDGTTKIVLCVVDSCMMPREFLDKVKDDASKATGIPTENMMISATHTHSAPAVMGCLGCDADKVYPEFLHRQIVRAITLAHKDLRPAKAGWAVTHAPKHTFNRRWILRSDKIRNDPFGNPTVRANMHPGYQNPDFIGPSGPVDDSLTLLALRALDDKPICTFCNFSMHYFGSNPVSSDYFGLFCDKLTKKAGGGVSVMSQGTSGDLMWMDYGSPKSDMTIDRYATELCDIAYEAYKKIEYKTDVPLKMKEEKLTLNRRVPDAKRLEWARTRLAALQGKKPTEQADIYAREAIALHEEPKRELKLQAIWVGDGGIAAIPNEVFAITAVRLKIDLPNVCVIELANGAEGYIPPRQQHDLGGYTTWPARTAGLEVKAEEEISGRILRMFIPDGHVDRGGLLGRYQMAVGETNAKAYWSFEERDEFSGVEAKNHVPGNSGEYEHGIARCFIGRVLESPHLQYCVHFAGGRIKANLKDLGPTYSAEFWFWNGFPTDVRDVTGYMFSRGNDGDKDALGDHLGIGGKNSHAGKLIFYNGNRAKQTLGGKTELKLKHWHHVVLVRDGKKVTVYLDGMPEFEGEADVTVPKDCGQIFFGGRCDKFAGFEGKLDEAAIYNRALTAKEIADHFAAAGKP